ncbi:hypothetical protein AVEN_113742-1 [Araneus ventricosus]|uniref:Uncharacterized protein n=1 Tax=Araneus ventricosus TaxID=182803 RepID=A0A4Y2MRC4_ARAVE|nr:hypothetical protein AVEN_113742-1 [Araneus ventricosus]
MMTIIIASYRAETTYPVVKMRFLPDSKRLIVQKPHILLNRTSILIASHRAETTHPVFKMCRIERKAHTVEQDVDFCCVSSHLSNACCHRWFNCVFV